MPEELAIALVIIVVIGWVVVKVFHALFQAAESTQSAIKDSFRKNQTDRHEKKRLALKPHCSQSMPSNLNAIENLLTKLGADLAERKDNGAWVPERPQWKKIDFVPQQYISQGPATQRVNVFDLRLILLPNRPAWNEREEDILSRSCSYPGDFVEVRRPPLIPLLVPDISIEVASLICDGKVSAKEMDVYFRKELDDIAVYNRRRMELLERYGTLRKDIEAWNEVERQRRVTFTSKTDAFSKEEEALFQEHAKKYEVACLRQRIQIAEALDGFRKRTKAYVIQRVESILSTLTLPVSVPRFWNVDYDEAEQILIVEVALPDVVHDHPIKTVKQKSGRVIKPLNQTERKEFVPKIHPAVMLRIAHELLRNDGFQTIKLLALNGWVDYIDPHTGRETRAYTCSLVLTGERDGRA